MHLDYTSSDISRFHASVDRSSPGPAACWLWTKSTNMKRGAGYGQFTYGGGHQPKHISAHVAAFELASGEPIPSGMVVCHDCPDGDTPTCTRNDEPGIYTINGVDRIRFGHLWLGTHADNTADKIQKGRARYAIGERSGQRLHPERFPRGEAKPDARLTTAQVVLIRDLAASGIMQCDLADRFGVSRPTISYIVRRMKWAHVL